MSVVGAIKGMERGQSLDYYTNAVIAAAFLALALPLKQSVTQTAKRFVW